GSRVQSTPSRLSLDVGSCSDAEYRTGEDLIVKIVLSSCEDSGINFLPDGRLSDLEYVDDIVLPGENTEDNAVEDGEVAHSEPHSSLTRVHSLSPGGSRSPSLAVHDLRGSARRSGTSRRSLTLAPSTTRENRPTAQGTLSIGNQQSVMDEVRAAQTMYLRRRQVSLEDTVAHSPSGADLVCPFHNFLRLFCYLFTDIYIYIIIITHFFNVMNSRWSNPHGHEYLFFSDRKR
ncbi:unnamed protein product, partial [Echinostoma caproni]|uniref:PIPK domain-containing protein n=1 Tax=Echinostoma caproni TaxID=27848 RepID=A0A183B886_9TREM